MKLNYFFLSLFALSIMFTACSKDDDEDTVENPTTPTTNNPVTADQSFTISNSGATAYVFQFTSIQNPELELSRGKTYEFKVNTPGHPLYINSTNTVGTASVYNDGVTNNGAATGSILFTVSQNAPDILWYNCEFHAPMFGRIRIVDQDSVRSFQVGNNGGTSYIFTGGGLNSAANPNFTFKRGQTYEFDVNTPGHPFLLKNTQGAGTSNMYNDGVTNNGTASGKITFTVPQNAPNTLYYNCEFHGVMTGVIAIID